MIVNKRTILFVVAMSLVLIGLGSFYKMRSSSSVCPPRLLSFPSTVAPFLEEEIAPTDVFGPCDIALVPKFTAHRILPRSRSKEKYFVSICMTLNNEATYLEEYIQHHILLGVEHFFVFLDNRTTDKAQALAALRPYIAEGVATCVKDGPQHQVDIQNYCVQQFANTSLWMAFLEPDAFLVPMNPRDTLYSILDGMHLLHQGFVILDVKFHANGQSRRLKATVGSRFTEKIGYCPGGLLILQPSLVSHVNVHQVEFKNNGSVSTFCGHSLASGGFKFLFCPQVLQLHHYKTKSFDEYEEKCYRGDMGAIHNPKDRQEELLKEFGGVIPYHHRDKLGSKYGGVTEYEFFNEYEKFGFYWLVPGLMNGSRCDYRLAEFRAYHTNSSIHFIRATRPGNTTISGLVPVKGHY